MYAFMYVRMYVHVLVYVFGIFYVCVYVFVCMYMYALSPLPSAVLLSLTAQFLIISVNPVTITVQLLMLLYISKPLH